MSPQIPTTLSGKSNSLWREYRDLLAWFILILDLIATIWIWSAVNTTIHKNAKNKFNLRVEEITNSITERLTAYDQILKGGIGLFAAAKTPVTRDMWKTYVDTLEISKKFPGIQGIGFALKIAPEDREEHIQKIRDEGFPDYNIHPEGERAEYTSIIYLEPFDARNRKAFGYDMFSQSTRRSAMEKARDTGMTSISGKVILVQEIDEDVQNGFLMYLPFYKSGLPLETLKQRQLALVGYIYSPFRINDLMLGILGHGVKDMDLSIYDGDSVDGDSILYQSTEGSIDEAGGKGLFVKREDIELYAHSWILAFESRPEFEKLMDSATPPFILVLGSLFSLLCFIVVHGAFTTRKKALQYADEMSMALRKSEDRLRLALEGTNDGLWDWNIRTGSAYFSPRLTEMLGYKQNELEGHVDSWKKLIHPDDAPTVMQAVEKHLNGETAYYQTEHRLKMKSGEWLWVLDRGKVVERDDAGKPLRAVGTHANMSSQKHAEVELEKMKTAIEESPVAFVITDLNANIEFCNSFFLKTTGYAHKDVIGKNMRFLRSGKQDTAFYENLWKTILSGQVWKGEFHNKKKDGSLYWESATIAPLSGRDGQITHFVAIKEDVTERKSIQHHLELSSRFNASILNSVGEGIYGIDLEGRVTFWNPAATAILGYTADELLEKKQHAFLRHAREDGTSYEHEDCPIHLSMISGQVRRIDNEFFCSKEGRLIPVEYTCHPILQNGNITGAVITFSDISERRSWIEKLSKYQNELEVMVHDRTLDLKESQRKLTTLIENLPGLVYRCRNDSDRTMIFIAGACVELTGYSPDDFATHNTITYSQLVHPEDRGGIFEQVQSAVKKGQPFRLTYRIITAAGLIKWVGEYGQTIFNERGDVDALEGFVIDITKEHEVDRIKSEFVATAAHELRTPLTTIVGYAELIKIKPGLAPEKVQAYADHIYKESQILSKIIDDLLDLSRMESGAGLTLNRRWVDILETIAPHLQKIRESNPSRQYVEKFPDGSGTWFVDPDKIRQILSNLYSNATKYSPQDTPIETLVEITAKMVRVSVKNKGEALTPKQLGRVFEKFYRLPQHTHVSGTGLGLSISKMIATAHGGDISLKNTGDGTITVTFILPNSVS